jgi:hypothetical protein
VAGSCCTGPTTKRANKLVVELAMIQIIPFVLALMIIYDFSAHLFDVLIDSKKTTLKHPFGMYKLMDRFGGENKEKRQKIYNVFWTTYWGIASVLIIIYLIFKK